MDIAEKMLLSSKVKFNNLKNIICGDAHFIPLKNNLIDKIICFSAFPHFSDKKNILKEFYRLLSKNGSVLILHFDSSAKLNSMHKNYNPAIADDFLPDINDFKSLLHSIDFEPVKLLEKEGLYFALFKKK